MAQQLDEQFLLELYKGCITSKNFLEVIVKHLKFHYIPEEAYKLIFEKMVQDYELLSSLSTIGTLTQHFNGEKDHAKKEKIFKVLMKIKETRINEDREVLLNTFQEFIKKAMFLDLYNQLGNLYNDGKHDKAHKVLEERALEMANFSIKDNYYTKVIGNFEGRNEKRKEKVKDEINTAKIPFGIHALDYFTRGGINRGTTALIMGLSGKGKSTFMRWVGVNAARAGLKVVHFQIEGSEAECLDAYDSAITSVDLEDIEFGNIPLSKVDQIKKTYSNIYASGGEIFVKASESFDSMSINDCDDILEDIVKIHGPIDLIIWDYYEIMQINGKYAVSEAGERKRRNDIGEKMSNLAIKYNAAGLSGTQANDITPDKYNSPKFYMTRSDLSEFKGAVKPFSFFISINQTDEEAIAGIMRLWIDKMRKYKLPYKQLTIAQALNVSRFYNAQKSLEIFWDDNKHQLK